MTNTEYEEELRFRKAKRLVLSGKINSIDEYDTYLKKVALDKMENSQKKIKNKPVPFNIKHSLNIRGIII